MNKQTLILVGSSSIHTTRYLDAVIAHFSQVVFISHNLASVDPELLKRVSAYDFNFKLNNFACRFQIAKLLTKYDPQTTIIHIQQANSFAYHTLKAVKRTRLKFKTILTTWGSDVLVLPRQNLIFRNMVKFNLEHVDIITSDSLYMSSVIRQLSAQVQHLYTINFGIKHCPSQVDLSAKQNIILSTRLHKALYNIEEIILAYARYVHNNPQSNYKLIIVGEGELTPKLETLIKALNLGDQIQLVGMLGYAQLVEILAKAKLFISIPKSDATSLSVLEAMAYGCYPILSNLPANLEWVIDKINGTICQNPNDLDQDIATAIKYLDDPTKYEKLARFNLDLIQSKARFENNIEHFIKLYNETV